MPLASNILFTETQRYNEIWIKYLTGMSLTSVTALFIYLLIAPVNTVPGWIGIGIFGVWVFLLIVFLVVFFNSLSIRIDEQGITFNEMPSKVQQWHEWKDIHQILFVQYKNGIWGVRSSIKNGPAFNLRGKAGIQIIFKNGQKIQLGIQKLKEAKAVIEQYCQTDEARKD